MFDFEKLDVYAHLRNLNKVVLKFLFSNSVSDLGQISQTDFNTFYNQYEAVSKMLLGLYHSK